MNSLKGISGGITNKITTQTKVSEFLGWIVRVAKIQELYVIAKDNPLEKSNAKQDNEYMSVGDRLLIYSESQKTDSYNIAVIRSQKDAVDFGGVFNVENDGVSGYKIVSGTQKLTNKLKSI